MEERALLKRLSEAHGVSGHEDEVRELIAEALAGIGELRCDKAGSLMCELPATKGVKNAPRVMLAAHADEIGFLVQNITADGFLQLVPIGGWWGHTLLSQRVQVKTRTGKKVLGVIGSKPPHFLPKEQQGGVMPVESMFVDVGADSRAEVQEGLGVCLGDPVAPYVPMDSFDGLESNRVLGKAFDNRIGVAAMVLAMKKLAKMKHPNTVLATATVQEEVGTRGAKTAAHAFRPDCVLVLEGPPADDTPGFALGESQGKLNGGVQIRLYDPTAITNPRLARVVEETAQKLGIPYQLTVRRSGGTDAGAMHLVREGIPCVVLGVPTRYIHAHNGVADLRDLRSAVALIVALVKVLDAKAVKSLTDYLTQK